MKSTNSPTIILTVAFKKLLLPILTTLSLKLKSALYLKRIGFTASKISSALLYL